MTRFLFLKGYFIFNLVFKVYKSKQDFKAIHCITLSFCIFKKKIKNKYNLTRISVRVLKESLHNVVSFFFRMDFVLCFRLKIL